MIKVLTFIATLMTVIGIAGASYANPYLSDQESFQATIDYDFTQAPMRKLFEVPFSLLNEEGEPVLGAEIMVHGGMAAHGHGLPTSPVVETLANGNYVIRGLKLSMPGTWQLYLMINAGGQTDRIEIEFEY